jgi:beta-mannosidase
MKTVELLLLSLLSHSSSAKNVLDLTTHSWTLSNDALNISVPASLPSQAHLDLFAAGVIGDPYHDLNDFNLRWVALSNWTYSSGSLGELSRKANGSGNDSDGTTDKTWLLFDGLDTFASIEFCGRHVASTNNQFRQWWFDVSEIVDEACADEGAVLSVNFGSAPKIADQIAGEPGVETWSYGV